MHSYQPCDNIREDMSDYRVQLISLLYVYMCVSGNNNPSSDMMTVFGLLIKGTLVKYWIFCCCFMFFIISFSDKVAVYKILYICLFLFCVVLYEVSGCPL